MKIEYSCENCGKRFPTPEEAKRCESKHKHNELKEKSANTIKELIEKHIKIFNEFPNIILSDEAVEFMKNDVNSKLLDIVTVIEEMFGKEEE